MIKGKSHNALALLFPILLLVSISVNAQTPAERTTNLGEVVIRPNDSLVVAIIRKAIERRKLNDPEQLDSYSFNAYSKLYATLEGFDTDSIVVESDSLRKSRLNKQHLFMQESYTERTFLKPGHHNERVLANRFSGLKDPVFTLSVADYNSISIYKNYISILGVAYLTPLSDNSWHSFEFILDTETHREKDTLYSIYYRPKKSLREPSMQGVIHITSNRYAVEDITAQSTDEGAMIAFDIYQEYEQLGHSSFPRRLNTTFTFNQMKVRNRRMKLVYHGYLENIKENPPLKKKNFGAIALSFDPLANKRDSSYWEQNRIERMSFKDKNTYVFYDTSSIAKKARLDKVVKLIQVATLGYVPTKLFDVHWPRLFEYTEYEGARIGFGLSTNNGISKFFQLEGYASYGFRDRALKHGYGAKFFFHEDHVSFIRAFGSHDVVESASPNRAFVKQNATAAYGGVRQYLIYRMDSIRTIGVEYEFKPAPYLWANISISNKHINPTYDYKWRDLDRFEITEASVGLYYGPGQKITQLGNGSVISPPGDFSLGMRFTKSISGISENDISFARMELDLKSIHRLRRFGEFSYNFIAGFVSGHTPYPSLFNGKGSVADNDIRLVYFKNHFQTMGMTEFVSDTYASLFARQNFGPMFGTKSKYFRPELSITQSIGYGKLRNAEEHSGIEFKTMDKGYFESGVIIDNIIRLNYQNVFWLGFGAGGFMRYGDYRLSNTMDNTALKLSMKISY